jgi:hypothetical protein
MVKSRSKAVANSDDRSQSASGKLPGMQEVEAELLNVGRDRYP